MQPDKPYKIVVVDPPNLRPDRYINVVSNAPLASCLLSGYAYSRLKKKGFDVHQLDFTGKPDLEDFEKDIMALEAGEVCVNLLYQWENTERIMECLGDIRLNSGAKITLFGYFPTFFKKELLIEYPFIDSIIEGDPFYDGDGSLDPTPFVKGGGFAPILGSRGCWGDCSFCYAGRFFHGYQNKPVDNIVNEIEKRLGQGAQKVYFVDPCFFPPGRRAEGFARDLSREITKRRLRFSFGLECRSDSVSPGAIDPLLEVGLTEIFLGVESGSQSALDRFNKRTTVEKNEKAIALAQQRGIKLSIGFIMFDPEVRIEELQQNLEFLKRNRLLNCATNTAQLLSHKAYIYAGAPIYKKYIREIRPGVHPPYFLERPFKDNRVHKVYSAMEKEAKRVYRKFKGKDIDNPGMEGSLETAGELSRKFEDLLRT